MARKSNRLPTLAAASVLLAMTMAAPAQAQTKAAPLVGVTAIMMNAEIQAMIDGMQDRLAKLGRRPGESVTIEIVDAGADEVRAAAQARDFARRGAQVIVAITQPSIEAALGTNSRTPVVGAGITMETAARYTNERRRRPLTGVALGTTHGDQFALIRRLAPDVRTVAVPVDPIDGDMRTRLQDLAAVARTNQISVAPLVVSVLRNAVSNRISELTPDTSVILLDRGLLPAAPVEALVAASSARNLRLFASDEDSVIRGAFAAMVVEPFGIGLQLGDIVARILDEPAAARLPFERARATHLVVNRDARALVDLAAIEPTETAARQSVVDWADVAGPRPRIKPPAPTEPPPLGVVRGIDVPTPRSRPQSPQR